MERHGAAHSITQKLPGSTPQPGVRQTRVMQRQGWDTQGWNLQRGGEGRLRARKLDEHFQMSTWSGQQGHSAEVEERQGENRYVAGPYRTQYRSQVAAEALTERARGGDADRYRRNH
jgi:hypothetical protein